jgi:hypothetical protein
MTVSKKLKRRGFVMTGGGAKGLYEAGVIHAFHIAGMEFDVITGSSIGAFNSIFFAEYQLRKRQLPDEVRENPEKAVEAMDSMVKAYHHAWLRMPEKRIVDDSDEGALGQLKDDLLHFNVNLPDITQLYWWWTDPDRGSMPSPGVWPALVKLGKELVERLGNPGELLQILKYNRDDPFKGAILAYLARFGVGSSLVAPEDDQKLTSVFIEPTSPLRLVHLLGKTEDDAGKDSEKVTIILPHRTLRDYAQEGIDVRLTRANLRTGRLEISTYQSTEDFIKFMEKQSFRLEKADPEKIPLGSFRLQLPGNPDAVNSALASGRFPGVLAPYPIDNIYPPEDPENALMYKMLSNWLNDPEVETAFNETYKTLHPEEDGDKWVKTYSRWRESHSMRAFFPQADDIYVDGGAIDNTPSNSAIDSTREWAEDEGVSKSDIVLDSYVVFLHPEPIIEQIDVQDLAFHEIAQRTLEIQGAAKQSSDAVVVDTINTFGRRGERLGETLLLLLDSYQEAMGVLDDDQKEAILDQLREKAREMKLRGYLGRSSEGILERMEDWASDLVYNRLPLQVNEVIIYPEEMPMSTLQFTERLGYRQENAINMLTMGCYHTLWTTINHLDDSKKDRDAQDERVLALAKKWMGIEELPEDASELEEIHSSWNCQRTACVFHVYHCPRGGRKT